MVYSLLNALVISFFFNNIKEKDAFFSCPAKIEALSVISLASTFSPVRAADRFFAIFSAFFRSLA